MMYSNSRKLTWTWLAVAAFAVGCSTDEPVADLEVRDSAVEPAEEHQAGSVMLEYNPSQSNGVSVHAQFLDVSGVSVAAAFDALDVWTLDSELGLDACTFRTPPESEPSEDVRLHMLDVGPISVSALDHAIRLDGRRVPDLRTFSGVVYGNEEGFDLDEAFVPYTPGGQYQLVAPGGEEAGGFHVSLRAPAVPEIEAINGRYVVDSAPVDLRGEGLDMTWTPGADDTALYLDIGHYAATPTLRCRLDDDGDFTVPSSVLDQVGGADPLRVSLRRVDSIELAVDGIEEGDFLFASTDELSIQR